MALVPDMPSPSIITPPSRYGRNRGTPWSAVGSAIGVAHPATAGRVTVNLVPRPGSLSKSSEPPCARTIP